MARQVSSSAFSEGQPIPEKYSCDGRNLSPPLKWNGAPIVIIADDPDAPVRNIHALGSLSPPGQDQRTEGRVIGCWERRGKQLQKNGLWRALPSAERGASICLPRLCARHRFAWEAGLSKQDVSAAMKRHVLAEDQVIGNYKRAK